MRLLLVTLILVLAAPLQAAKLEFVGLRSYTEKGLKEAIAGRLDYISKRDATPFRADDAAFLVETYLRSHGLPDATVSWTVSSKEEIILNVNEGIAKFLGTITVQGYDDVEAVQDQFKAPFPESGENRAFDAEAVETGISRVTALLNADGYWESSLTSKQGTRSENGKIPFTLDIKKGPLFTLVPPLLESSVPPPEKLQQLLLGAQGRKATAEAIVSLRKAISESYRRLGYSNINLEMEKETADTRLRLIFKLTPGKKFIVRSFATSGVEKTVPLRVIDRFSKLIGQNYDEDAANEAIKKLLTTGAFDSIRLETEESDTDLDLTLHLRESKARGYSLAGGFGSIEGYVFGARYYDRNLWGRLWNLSAGIEVTSLGVLGEIARTDPFFLNRDLSLNNRAYLITRDYDNYATKQGGLTNELSWDIGDHYSATLGIENSIVSTSTTLPDGLIGPEKYFNHRLNFRQTYDRRDDPTLPADGWFARFDTSLGYVHGDTSVSYFETDAQLSYYRTLGDNTSYALGLRGGVIVANGSQENLPIDLRKFLGGANSVRCFPEREMGPNFNGTPLGGTTWWLANAEYNHTLAGPVRWLIFLDAGALDDDLEFAAGVGLRLDLPVGPIRLEYGRSLSRDSGEPSGAFHFAIGSTF